MTVTLSKSLVAMIPEGRISQQSLYVNSEGRLIITGTKEHVNSTMKNLMGGN